LEAEERELRAERRRLGEHPVGTSGDRDVDRGTRTRRERRDEEQKREREFCDAVQYRLFLFLRDRVRAQDFLDVVLNFVPPFQAECLVHNFTLTVNIERLRQELHSAVSVPD